MAKEHVQWMNKMAFFSPRSLRIEADCAVEIRLQEYGSGNFLPGKCEGNLTNVSRDGACIILPKMLLEGKHLFFATLDSKRYHLVIFITNPPKNDAPFRVAARSVWMDSCWYKDGPAFKVGVSFHENQKRLFQFFREMRRTV